MDVQALRFWGMAVGAALMAFALWVAAMGPDAPPHARPADRAQNPGVAPEPASFVVRFQGRGPIARAQAVATRGDTDSGRQRIEAQLQRQQAFAGLCFERFTANAGEVVLRTCDVVASHERAALERQWLSRLRAMRAVAYADVESAAAADRAE